MDLCSLMRCTCLLRRFLQTQTGRRLECPKDEKSCLLPWANWRNLTVLKFLALVSDCSKDCLKALKLMFLSFPAFVEARTSGCNWYSRLLLGTPAAELEWKLILDSLFAIPKSPRASQPTRFVLSTWTGPDWPGGNRLDRPGHEFLWPEWSLRSNSLALQTYEELRPGRMASMSFAKSLLCRTFSNCSDEILLLVHESKHLKCPVLPSNHCSARNPELRRGI